jgi:hypothetical protein
MPYMLFCNLKELVQPSVHGMVCIWKCIVERLMGDGNYNHVSWGVLPITLYEVDIARETYYEYREINIVCVNGEASLSIPHRRVRAWSVDVESHITILVDYE